MVCQAKPLAASALVQVDFWLPPLCGCADVRCVLAGHRNARSREFGGMAGQAFHPEAFDWWGQEALDPHVEVLLPITWFITVFN